jgi:hypothetical protein
MSFYEGSGLSPTTITTANALAKTGPGRLGMVIPSASGATTAGLIQLYDALTATGTPVATISLAAFSGANTPSSPSYGWGQEGIDLKTGLFVAYPTWTNLTIVVYTK